MPLAKKLKRLRQARKLTLTELAQTTGINNGYLSQLENGKATNPSADVLAKLATAYDVRMEWLIK